MYRRYLKWSLLLILRSTLPRYFKFSHPSPAFYVRVYDSVPDELIKLFDHSDDSDEDGTRTLDELFRKNKRRMRRLLRAVKKLNVSLKTERASFKKKADSPQETVKKDSGNQKKVTDSHFTNIDSLYMFRKDLQVKALACRD